MEVAPFFVDFHLFLSIFAIFYRFSRFTHFCRDLHFVAIYALFPQIFFGQNSLLRNITRFFSCMVVAMCALFITFSYWLIQGERNVVFEECSTMSYVVKVSSIHSTFTYRSCTSLGKLYMGGRLLLQFSEAATIILQKIFLFLFYMMPWLWKGCQNWHNRCARWCNNYNLENRDHEIAHTW